ncbi:TonB-dependent receptor [Granulicella sp. L60]|uniref:TonB-dependent receptor n=1 Tax=Granulicella sp. L60 TaxID=1641866 RepID=UPI00131E0FA6|nr:TonB-dependent receptor [Granulicella sp. L60]
MTCHWKKCLPLVIFLFAGISSFAQSIHGTVSGIVTDTQGAVIADAALQLTNPATGQVLSDKSNKAGEFNFPELPVGTYQLTAIFGGFQTKKIDDIHVEVSKVANLKVELSVGADNTIVDVSASGVQTDTTSSALVTVIDSKSVQDMPMNGRDFTQMVKFAPGVNLNNSVNGSRTASINFQVDGADNVDAYLGIVASNQGGIEGIPGGLIPIEAIDQFSMQAAGEADQGRNAGATQNMVLKSGTNQIHGDLFYFNRNEFFASISPVAPVDSRKPVIRNNQFGFTLGGPIWKDHTFLFLAGEIQLAKANNAISDTVLNDAWISAGTTFLQKYNLAPNPVTVALYKNVYPAVANGAGATTGNYFADAPSNYNSYNGVIKLDHRFTDKETLSIRYLGTTGRQTAITNSDYAPFFQTAPMHIHNFSVVQTSIFTSHLLNVVTLGTNYFLQTFNDADQNFNPATCCGLNLGLTGIIAAGSPTVTITGFDEIGATQPSGRTDVTGHVTDSLHWTIGAHSLKFGGEYRHANINLLYFSNSRGTFAFDGTRGPWNKGTATDNANCLAIGQVTSTGACSSSILSLADFLNGTPSNASGAKLLQGDAQRVYLLNTADAWAQDDYQVSPHLTVNYGIRYSFPGVVSDAKDDLYSFVPGKGFVRPLYNQYYTAFAPRAGFSYSPLADSRTAIRGSFGLFYDVPPMSNMVSGTTKNGGAQYTQNNPAGPDPAVIYSASNVQFAYNVNAFTGAAPPQLGAMGVNPNFRIPYSMNFSLNIEQQLSNTTLFTVGYVGTQGRRLAILYDLNQPIGYANGSYIRPFSATSYPGQTITNTNTLAGINQVNSGASSNYNSLQVTLRQSMWHGITATMNYTWSHSMDYASSEVNPMNSYNLKQDYGASTFDRRNVLTGFASYDVPQLGHFAPRLTKGWQVNALYTFTGGSPLSPLIGKDVSLTDQNNDRPNVVANVKAYSGRTLKTVSSARQYQYLNPAAFASPATTPTFGVYGNEQRDAYYGPGLGDVDFSLFKHTPITERVNTEFRVECFNIANQANLANPSVTSITSSTFGLVTNTYNGSLAPGLGFGEPRNVQLALKVSF